MLAVKRAPAVSIHAWRPAGKLKMLLTQQSSLIRESSGSTRVHGERGIRSQIVNSRVTLGGRGPTAPCAQHHSCSAIRAIKGKANLVHFSCDSIYPCETPAVCHAFRILQRTEREIIVTPANGGDDIKVSCDTERDSTDLANVKLRNLDYFRYELVQARSTTRTSSFLS